ncbi:hypothetical protein D3C78_637560 [compost metagenome]
MDVVVLRVSTGIGNQRVVNQVKARQRASTKDGTLETSHHSQLLVPSFTNVTEQLLHQVDLVALEQAHCLTDRTLEHQRTLGCPDNSVHSVVESVNVSPCHALSHLTLAYCFLG